MIVWVETSIPVAMLNSGGRYCAQFVSPHNTNSYPTILRDLPYAAAPPTCGGPYFVNEGNALLESVCDGALFSWLVVLFAGIMLRYCDGKPASVNPQGHS